MLDNAGHEDCKIVVSNSMDEYIIRDVLLQGAQIDSFGVGEKLITSKPDPVFEEAMGYVNTIRNRAKLSSLKTTDYNTQEKFIRQLLTERSHEFWCENGQYRADLIRHNKFIQHAVQVTQTPYTTPNKKFFRTRTQGTEIMPGSRKIRLLWGRVWPLTLTASALISIWSPPPAAMRLMIISVPDSQSPGASQPRSRTERKIFFPGGQTSTRSPFRGVRCVFRYRPSGNEGDVLMTMALCANARKRRHPATPKTIRRISQSALSGVLPAALPIQPEDCTATGRETPGPENRASACRRWPGNRRQK